ncbi:hypothetical protein M3231_01835 [Neobacillus mesonae]|nr:hypothetical protein [Neobacillus mesonae]
MRARIKNKRIRSAILLVLISIALFFAVVYLNERAGGFADWRMAKALGINDGIIRIPLAQTPEEAVELFRGDSSSSVHHFIHQEPVDGGMLVFQKRYKQEITSNLQVEYVRKAWLGWKWVWGGGYSIGEGTRYDTAVTYMSMPKVKNLSTPFPMVFGEIIDPAVKGVTINLNGNGEYEAKLVEVDQQTMIWFVILPSTTSTPYEIKGFNEVGDIILNKMITDPTDSNRIELNASKDQP